MLQFRIDSVDNRQQIAPINYYIKSNANKRNI